MTGPDTPESKGYETSSAGRPGLPSPPGGESLPMRQTVGVVTKLPFDCGGGLSKRRSRKSGRLSLRVSGEEGTGGLAITVHGP